MSQQALAAEYGVAQGTVSSRVCREGWRQPRPVRKSGTAARRCLTGAARQLNLAVSAAAERMEAGGADVKEIRELAGVLQALVGLEKALEPPRAAKGQKESAVQVVLSPEAEELSR